MGVPVLLTVGAVRTSSVVVAGATTADDAGGRGERVGGGPAGQPRGDGALAQADLDQVVEHPLVAVRGAETGGHHRGGRGRAGGRGGAPEVPDGETRRGTVVRWPGGRRGMPAYGGGRGSPRE